jgi:hypothetical protein
MDIGEELYSEAKQKLEEDPEYRNFVIETSQKMSIEWTYEEVLGAMIMAVIIKVEQLQEGQKRR